MTMRRRRLYAAFAKSTSLINLCWMFTWSVMHVSKTKSTLTTHLVTLTIGKDPHECSKCNATFKWKVSLINHEKKGCQGQKKVETISKTIRKTPQAGSHYFKNFLKVLMIVEVLIDMQNFRRLITFKCYHIGGKRTFNNIRCMRNHLTSHDVSKVQFQYK